MSYIHLTKTKLIFIEEYHELDFSGHKIANKLKRGHEAVYRVIRKLRKGLTAVEIYLEYQEKRKNASVKKSN